MDYRISERAMVTSCAVGILIVMLGNRRQSLMMSAVGAAVMVLGILQALVFYKCPHCKKRFKIGSRRPSVCPYCGETVALREWTRRRSTRPPRNTQKKRQNNLPHTS